jgi:hypothetical protein
VVGIEVLLDRYKVKPIHREHVRQCRERVPDHPGRLTQSGTEHYSPGTTIPIRKRRQQLEPGRARDLAEAGVELPRPARKDEDERPGARLFKPLRHTIESINIAHHDGLQPTQHEVV